MGLFSKDTSASDAAQQALAIIQKSKPDSLEVMRSKIIPLLQQGTLAPQQADTIDLDPSSFEDIEEDPSLRARLVDAINQYKMIADEGGNDAIAKAGLNEALNTVNTANRGRDEAIMANARARGAGGADLEFVNRLLAQQSGSQAASQAAVTAAAEAQRRKMDALKGSTDTAGALRDQDYRRSAERAQAADLIQKFNAANRQQQANLNTGITNTAMAQNLGEKQRVADSNASAANNLILPQATLKQNHALNKATAVQTGGQLQGAENKDQNDKTWQTVGTAASMAAMMMSDKRTKDDVEDLKPGQLLDELTGKTWKYKGESEPTAGIMADDVERASPGAVVTGPDGLKRVDVGRLGGVILAALADTHKRMKKAGI